MRRYTLDCRDFLSSCWSTSRPGGRQDPFPGVGKSGGRLLLTDEANDAAHQRVEVTTVSGHDGFLLSQQSFSGGLHHVHGHFTDENLTEKQKNSLEGKETRQRNQLKVSESETGVKDQSSLNSSPSVMLQAPPITEGRRAQVAMASDATISHENQK